MLQYFSADWIFPVNSEPVKNGVVATTVDGEIVNVYTKEAAKEAQIEHISYYRGAIVPGFINAHCHLELSHMLEKIPERTGLIAFIKRILQFRDASETEIVAAAKNADREMYENGIVAVGDISNKAITAGVKRESKIYYHTFLEVLGLKGEMAQQVFTDALKLSESFKPLSVSIVPHAPYSVSGELFAAMAGYAGKNANLISIHNQETEAENLFFESKTGAFLEFYDFLGIDISMDEPKGVNSIRFHLPQLPKNQSVLLVHNTFTNLDDINFAAGMHQQLYWCLCPNANLYIENNLPDVRMMEEAGIKLTLGTDSLSSNHQLNILDEMRVLQEQKQIAFESLLRWATWNGAEFLGITDRFGSIAPGKRPGLNLIPDFSDFKVSSNKVIKLI